MRRAGDRHVRTVPEVELVQGRTRMVQRAVRGPGGAKAGGSSSSGPRRPTRVSGPNFCATQRGHAMPGFSFYDPESGDPWGFQLREPNDDYFKELGRSGILADSRACASCASAPRSKSARRRRVAAAARGAVQRRTVRRRIYLHAPPDSEPRAPRSVAALTKRRHCTRCAPAVGAGNGLADWQNEARQRDGSGQALRSARAAARRRRGSFRRRPA